VLTADGVEMGELIFGYSEQAASLRASMLGRGVKL